MQPQSKSIMTFSKIVKYLPFINIILIVILFVDFYVLPTHDILESPDHEMLERSFTNRNKSYLTYSLVSKSGQKYHIPEKLEPLVPTDSDFVAQRTFLLHLKRDVLCHSIYGHRRFNIGYFNSNEFVQILIIGLLIASIFNLKYPGHDNAQNNLVALSCMTYFVLIIISLIG